MEKEKCLIESRLNTLEAKFDKNFKELQITMSKEIDKTNLTNLNNDSIKSKMILILICSYVNTHLFSL